MQKATPPRSTRKSISSKKMAIEEPLLPVVGAEGHVDVFNEKKQDVGGKGGYHLESREDD